jgi:hypothetical protein
MPDPAPITSPNLGGLLGILLGGGLGGSMGGSTPAGNTTTTTGQTLAPGGLQNIQDTIAGRYLDPSSNPYLSSTYDAAARQVTPRVNSIFELGGRYGSGMHQGILGQNLSDLANNIYGTNYQNERTRQFAAATSPIGNTVASPYFTNPLAGILSGALGGGVLGNLFGGSLGGAGGLLNGLPAWLRNMLPGGGTSGNGAPAGVGGPPVPGGDLPAPPPPGNGPPQDDPYGGGFGGLSAGFRPGLPGIGGQYGAYPKPVATSPYARRIG